METTQTHLSVSRRTLLAFGVSAIVIVATALTVSVQQRPSSYQGDIPLPFGEGGSDLQGSILYYGKRNNIDVYEISFAQNERMERMQTDLIYLVHVPAGTDVVTTSLDDVISTYNPAGIKNVDYYGYKYSDSVATAERAATQQPLFKNRFPAQFFASAKARINDPAHQNAISTFETQNGVFFRPTSGSGAIELRPNSLYAFVVNETNGANISIRTPICQNGILESTEVCDDGNTNNADCCKNDCTGGLPIPFGTCSSASAASSVASSTASSTVSSAASSVASSAQSSAAASSQASSAATVDADATVYIQAPSVTSVVPGTSLTYKVTAANLGPSAANLRVEFRIQDNDEIRFERSGSDMRCNFIGNNNPYANYECLVGMVGTNDFEEMNLKFTVLTNAEYGYACEGRGGVAARAEVRIVPGGGNDTNGGNNIANTPGIDITCQSSSAASSVASSQASSAGAVCGNGAREGSEACDSGSGNGQVCTPPACSASQTMTGCQYCSASCQIVIVDQQCGSSSSAASSVSSSQPAVVYPLSLEVLQSPPAQTATAGQSLSLLKFRVKAGAEAALLKGVMFTTQAGSLDNATQFELYRTGVTTPVASAAPVNGRLTFFQTSGLGTAVPAGTSVDFEVTARAAATPAAVPTVQLRLYTQPSNYIIATVGGDMLGDIRTNGTCLFTCDINVTTVPATLWTVQTGTSACGANTPDAGCEAGPSATQACVAPYGSVCFYCDASCKKHSATGPFCGDHIQQRAGADGAVGTADDEQCDDGNTTNNDSCSNACKLVAAPF
jgi:cysteine-rich repeat protein